MNHTLSEPTPFELFKEGDIEACSHYFKRYHEGVYHYIRSMAADVETARILTQDVFKQLWDLRGNIQSEPELGAYVFVRARILFLEHLRRLNRLPDATRELADAARRSELNDELEVVCHRVLGEMRVAMQRLSTKRKLVLQLLYIKELDINTVAQTLRLSPQTVRNHKSQAIAFLRERLADRDLVMDLNLNVLLRYSEAQPIS